MRIAKKLGIFVGLMFAGLSSIGFAKDQVSVPNDQTTASNTTSSAPVSLTSQDMDQVVAGGGSTDGQGHEASGHDSGHNSGNDSEHDSKPVIRDRH